jgi:hypothetical protein
MSDSDDPARAYESLRVETATMLGLNLADLSPAASLRLDLTALLRLSLDSLQGIALSGQEVDLARLQSCFSMLSKLLPQAVEAPPQLRESHTARNRLLQIVNDIAAVQAEDEADEIAELQARLAEKAAVIAALTLTVAPREVDQPLASPPPPTPQPQTSPQPPLPPPSSAPPAHYLARHDEPWRSVTSDRWRNNNV